MRTPCTLPLDPPLYSEVICGQLWSLVSTFRPDHPNCRLHVQHGCARGGRAEDDNPSLPALYLLYEDGWGGVSFLTISLPEALQDLHALPLMRPAVSFQGGT